MIVTCVFQECPFYNEGFCAKEKLSIRSAGSPQSLIPVCECFVSQLAGEKGLVRQNEYSLRQKKIDLIIETPDFHEPEAEVMKDN